MGQNIGKVRELLGVKQDHLAHTLKTSQQTISKIEQTQHLSDAIIERIAQALEVNASVIVNYDPDNIIEFLKTGSASERKQNKTLDLFLLFQQLVTIYEKLLDCKYNNL